MSDTPEAPLAFSHVVPVTELPPAGIDVTLEPGEAELAALARHVGVLALERLVAVLHVSAEAGDRVRVAGTVSATVRQTCVVSLEPFDSELKEAVDVEFAPASVIAEMPEAEEGEETRDPPDELVDGTIDLGALVGEFLALGVDPYPRKPGVVFEQPEQGEATLSPFAALARLKERP